MPWVSLWLLALWLTSFQLQAQWTGISASLEETNTDWQFASTLRSVRINRIGLQIEEKTAKSLRVGGSIGQLGLRLVDPATPSSTQKFDLSYIGLYLRQPIRLSANLALQGLLSYRYHSGIELTISDAAEIDWHETRFQIGLSLQAGQLRIMPFVAYTRVSGDITDSSGVALFDAAQADSHGISFDYLIEPGAYIRLQWSAAAERSGQLVFVREY